MKSMPGPKLPEHLRQLVDYCRSADIIICLVNIKDFLGEGDPERGVDNQIVIKSVLYHLSSDGNHRILCLLLLFHANRPI